MKLQPDVMDFEQIGKIKNELNELTLKINRAEIMLMTKMMEKHGDIEANYKYDEPLTKGIGGMGSHLIYLDQQILEMKAYERALKIRIAYAQADPDKYLE